MKASEATLGRIFVARLEDGDKIPACLEAFAREKGIKTASVLLIGGLGAGQVVVGPRDSARMPPDPMLVPIDGAHEVVGIGLLAPDKDGRPRLHMHASLGRAGQAKTGCVRPGVVTWLVGEAVIYELLRADVARLHEAASGFELLQVQPRA